MIPLADPKISTGAKAAVGDVLDSGQISSGEVVKAFEREFSDFIGTDYAIATSSGTSALHAMIEGFGIGNHDRVVTTPFSFIATANAVRHAGAEPEFADVHPDTYNLDPEQVRRAIVNRNEIAAIMPVHLFGLPAEMAEFQTLAEEFGVPLLADAAQAHGAMYEGKMVGSISDAAAFSFYPTKNMTTGEGGMITTDNEEVATRVRKIIDHGRTQRGTFTEIGYNYRMNNIQAAIGLKQLERLSNWCEIRRRNATHLTEELSGSSVKVPIVPFGRTHAFNQYTIRTVKRPEVIDALTAADIDFGIYYSKTIPNQPAYNDSDQILTRCETAEMLSDEVISLPIHPSVNCENISKIGEIVRRAAGEDHD